MEEALLGWELLHGSDTESTDSVASNNESGSSSVIDDGMILSDHFSVDSLMNIPGANTDLTQFGVMEPGDSSRVDYGSEPRNLMQKSGEVQVDLGFDQLNVYQSGDASRVDYWSEPPNRRQKSGEVPVDLGLDQFNVYESGDACVRNELGLYDSKTGTSGDGEVLVSDIEAADEKHVEGEVVSELTGGTLSHYEDASNKCLSESDYLELDDGMNAEIQYSVEEPIEDSSKSLSDSGIVSVGGDVSTEAIEASVENTVEVVAVSSDVRSGNDESNKRETVWWKMPFVLLKYCTFRIGPVWSVSMAAAVMGLVLLGRKLYNMKKKAQRFHLKVTIDDKKVSRVMSQAARLNEVFTEVRRVPVIRPALLSPGTWPALSLR